MWKRPFFFPRNTARTEKLLVKNRDSWQHVSTTSHLITFLVLPRVYIVLTSDGWDGNNTPGDAQVRRLDLLKLSEGKDPTYFRTQFSVLSLICAQLLSPTSHPMLYPQDNSVTAVAGAHYPSHRPGSSRPKDTSSTVKFNSLEFQSPSLSCSLQPTDKRRC